MELIGLLAVAALFLPVWLLKNRRREALEDKATIREKIEEIDIRAQQIRLSGFPRRQSLSVVSRRSRETCDGRQRNRAHPS
jgi:hypothetical protein